MQKFCNTIEETLIQRALLRFVSDSSWKAIPNGIYYLYREHESVTHDRCYALGDLPCIFHSFHFSLFFMKVEFKRFDVKDYESRRYLELLLHMCVRKWHMQRALLPFVLDSSWKAIPNDIYFFTNALVGEDLISILPFKQVKLALANKITETLLLEY